MKNAPRHPRSPEWISGLVLTFALLLTVGPTTAWGDSASRVQARILDPAGGAPRAAVRLHLPDAQGELRPSSAPELDPSGGFELDLPPRGALVEVIAEGYHRGLRWLARPPAGELQLVLQPLVSTSREAPAPRRLGTRLNGRAIDSAGRAVAGAEVQVMRLDFRAWTALPIPFLSSDGYEEISVTADTEGRFELELQRRVELPAEDRAAFEVVCRAPGHASVAVPVQREDRQSVTCRLGIETAAVAGVLRGDDRPASSWPLSLVAGTPGAPVVEMLASDADGRFAASAGFPRAAKNLLVLNVPEYLPRIQVVGPDTLDVEVPLERGADLEVELVDAKTGHKVETAAVHAAVRVDALELTRAAQLTEGTYRLPNLPLGMPARLRIEAPGYQPRDLVQTAGAQPGDTETLSVELLPAAAVAARITDAEGRPVAGARLSFAVAEGRVTGVASRVGKDPSGFSDHDGRVYLSGLTEETTYQASCTAEGFAPWWRQDLVPRDGVLELSVVLDRGARVEGYVLHEDGTPVEDAQIWAFHVTRNPDRPGHLVAAPQAQKSTLTDAEGRYVLDHLTSGTYTIGLDIDAKEFIGWFPTEDDLPLLQLLDGDVLSDLSFYLHTPSSLRLSAPTTAGGELTALDVTFYQRTGTEEPFEGGRISASARRDPVDGSYTVTGIAPGIWDVEARVPGFAPARFEGVELEGGFETRLGLDDLRQGQELQIQVVDARQLPVPGISIALYRVTAADRKMSPSGTLTHIPDENPSLVRTRSNDEGWAVVADLEPGEYQLHVFEGETAGDGRFAYETFTLTENLFDRGVERTVVLEDGFTVPIRVESAGGTPLPGASLVLSRRVEGFSGLERQARADPAGEVKFESLPPGLYDAEILLVRVEDPSLVSAPTHRQTLSIVDGSPHVLRVP